MQLGSTRQEKHVKFSLLRGKKNEGLAKSTELWRAVQELNPHQPSAPTLQTAKMGIQDIQALGNTRRNQNYLLLELPFRNTHLYLIFFPLKNLSFRNNCYIQMVKMVKVIFKQNGKLNNETLLFSGQRWRIGGNTHHFICALASLWTYITQVNKLEVESLSLPKHY